MSLINLLSGNINPFVLVFLTSALSIITIVSLLSRFSLPTISNKNSDSDESLRQAVSGNISSSSSSLSNLPHQTSPHSFPFNKDEMDNRFDLLKTLITDYHNTVNASLQQILAASSSSSSSSASAVLPASAGRLAPFYLGTRPMVDMSVHVVCSEEDWRFLGDVLGSIAEQTYVPAETILILSTEDDAIADGRGKKLPLHLFPSLPGFQVYIRGGRRPPGNNRMFAAKKSTRKLLTFFDCDDYMHPQRTEILHETFVKHSSLHAALHAYLETNDDVFNEVGGPDGKEGGGKTSALKTMFLTSTITAEQKNDFVPCEYAEIRRAAPNYGLTEGELWSRELLIQKGPEGMDDCKDCDVFHSGAKLIEPNWKPAPDWWFPHNMAPKCGNKDKTMTMGFHNGWLTLRREVLQTVEYPNLHRFEDGLFNWRTIKAGFNFTGIPFILGAYVHHKEKGSVTEEEEAAQQHAMMKGGV